MPFGDTESLIMFRYLRVTVLGHTGRKLVARKTEVACYALVTLAAVVRVFVPLLNPHWISDAVLVSALLWSSGFALYTWRYWPVLSREF